MASPRALSCSREYGSESKSLERSVKYVVFYTACFGSRVAARASRLRGQSVRVSEREGSRLRLCKHCGFGDTGGGSCARSAVGLFSLGGCMGVGESRRGGEAESQGEYASRTARVGCESCRFGAGHKADAGTSGEPYLPRSFLQRKGTEVRTDERLSLGFGRGERSKTSCESEDGTKPHLQRLHKAPGSRPCPDHRPCAREAGMEQNGA